MTPALLRETLAYDPATGHFTWLAKTGKRAVVGRRAGWQSKDGYARICVHGEEHQAHRLAWLYVHGDWPMQDIDHINGDRADNRIANLRDVSRSVNLQNRRAAGQTRTGVLGVSANGTGFKAEIKSDRRMHLGTFPTTAAASAAYLAAKRQHHEGNTL